VIELHQYTKKIDRCPYCGSRDLRFVGMMTETVKQDRRIYEVLAVWECYDCKTGFRDYVVE
jgi:DNA-directed RNA polymerase subunit RPC12/RpoP